MDYLVLPRAKEVRGAVRAPSSKSATNRALLLASLSSEPVEIVRPLGSGDTAALLGCLRAMGARISEAPDAVTLSGPLSAGTFRETLLDAGDSGTAARFLAAVCAAIPGRFRLDGSQRLRERPMEELVASLRSAGAEISCPRQEGFLPLAIRGGTLLSGAISVDAGRSSQFLSALLLAAVAVPGGLTVRSTGGVASAPYVEATLEALEAFGHEVRRHADAFAVRRGGAGPNRYEVPGDHSSAVPLLAAAGAAGGSVTVVGVSRHSRAADARALAVLERMGIALEAGPDRVTATAVPGSLRPVEVEATDFPDSVPPLAALAALARGESRFGGIGHLRFKESDRIGALATLIAAAGGEARAAETELVVAGGLPSGGALAVLPTSRDHRIAMAAALLSLARGHCLIEDPGCVAKSYPGFFRDLAGLAR
ncbi:MAG: 3-phosphoshikimate 1-carboxyvinyltransferase [Thermoanaerobaculia bacterium]